jgi:D-glycero-D-manno-heptose 1,7-bisphosphate phosphatase
MNKKAVFLDRDNTIIRDIPYSGDPSSVKLIPHAAEALRMLKSRGFELFLITNQSGVARGLIAKDQVQAVNSEMNKQLGDSFLTAVYCCYDHPDHPTENCRKPSPKMIFQARDDYGLDLKSSFSIGDKLSDVLTGKNAGCRSVLVLTGEKRTRGDAENHADFVAKDLLAAAYWICEQDKLP